MRKANTALALILGLLVATGVYYLIGTGLKAEVRTSRDGDALTLAIHLGNGSLFPYESLEFITAPDASALVSAPDAGEDIGILAEKDVQVTLTLPEGQSATLEIGYYVLGMRKTVTLSIQ